MAKRIKEHIREIAIRILENHPEGVRYSDLVRQIQEFNSSFKTNTIHGTVHGLESVVDKVEKPSRGLYRIAADGNTVTPLVPTIVQEEKFYQPFAEWLKNDVEDVTKAIALGGNVFKDKWGTPDVVGKLEPKASDIVKQPTEIVSAEIKINTTQLITAFGQACAYCLFSHRSYLVVPTQGLRDELSRLDSLCQVFGIGFVLFDAERPDDPKFEIRVRPKKQDPDMYYTNKYMKKIEQKLFS